jgi:hypothetical protein
MEKLHKATIKCVLIGGMDMWSFNTKGEKEFSGGKGNWSKVAEIAKACPNFKADEEDEQVSDETVSCYNCRYRKWSLKSFICMKPDIHNRS